METKHKVRSIEGSDAEEAKEEMNTKHNYRLTGLIIGRIRTERGISQVSLPGGQARRSVTGNDRERRQESANADILRRNLSAEGMRLSKLISHGRE